METIYRRRPAGGALGVRKLGRSQLASDDKIMSMIR